MPAPGAALVLPSVGERGMEFPTDGARPVARDFTPRHFDHARTELTIDVALHAHGPATDWAATVTEGQEVGIGGPRGTMLIPDSLHTPLDRQSTRLNSSTYCASPMPSYAGIKKTDL